MHLLTLLREKTYRFFKEESGASAIEYAIIAGLIAVVMIGTAEAVGLEIDKVFITIKEALEGINTSEG